MCSFMQVISLGYKSVAHYLITTQRGSANSEDSSSADSSSKLPSAKSETSCISEHDSTVAKEGLDDGETRSKAKTNKVTCCAAKNYDGYKDDCRSESVVTPDSQDDQASMDPGCVTLSEPTPRKRKYVERNRLCCEQAAVTDQQAMSSSWSEHELLLLPSSFCDEGCRFMVHFAIGCRSIVIDDCGDRC